MAERESTDFLYPFIESDERDTAGLLADLARSADAKAVLSEQLRAATLTAYADALAAAATAMAERFLGGGQLFVFGNGGSSTDAATIAELYARPPIGRGFPARSLVDDQAVLTALSNDVGFELVFSRQLIAHARAGDIALGVSTSGNSQNLMTAFAEARRRNLLTVGLAGHDGGGMAVPGVVEHCIVVRSDSVHRVQETQAGVALDLWDRVQRSFEEMSHR